MVHQIGNVLNFRNRHLCGFAGFQYLIGGTHLKPSIDCYINLRAICDTIFVEFEGRHVGHFGMTNHGHQTAKHAIAGAADENPFLTTCEVGAAWRHVVRGVARSLCDVSFMPVTHGHVFEKRNHGFVKGHVNLITRRVFVAQLSKQRCDYTKCSPQARIEIAYGQTGLLWGSVFLACHVGQTRKCLCISIKARHITPRPVLSIPADVHHNEVWAFGFKPFACHAPSV